LVDEDSTGNRMCLDDCVRLSRIYTSTFPDEATIRIVVTALEKAGYRCVIPEFGTANRDWCGQFVVKELSHWQRGSDGFRISFVVRRIPVLWNSASNPLSHLPIDPAWQSYVDVYVPD